jgi:hypothetical protein
MLLKALIVRSTTQKGESLSAPTGTRIAIMRGPAMRSYGLHGTDKLLVIAIEGTLAHGQGGNQGKLLVL